MHKTRSAILTAAVGLCLSVTGATSARADEQHERSLLGASVQVGSLAGFANFRGDVATAIGGQVGAYVRLGPATLGAEYDYLKVGDYPDRGALERYGLAARLDLLRLERGFGGPNTALILWVDGSLGHQRGHWHSDARVDRNDVGVGWGWLLEHRVRLSTRPRRLETVGWKFGWRLVTAPRYGSELAGIARCTDKLDCGNGEAGRYDVGLVVGSSLNIDW